MSYPRLQAARRFARRDDAALLDPALAAPLDAALVSDPALAVVDVVAVEPVEKTYRATVMRTVTQTAVVEFIAMEGTDTNTMAQGLLETIAPESWVTQPADSWGYIDSIEEVGAAAEVLDPADPLATPAALSRRRRALARRRARRFGRKSDPVAAQQFLDTLGQETVISEAEIAFGGVSAYIDDLGDIVVVDAAGGEYVLTDADVVTLAMACGWQSEGASDLLEDEVAAEDEEAEEEVPATLARRRRALRARRFARKMTGADAFAEINNVLAEVQAVDDALLAGGDDQAALDQLNALDLRLSQIFVDDGDVDADAAYAALAEAMEHVADVRAGIVAEVPVMLEDELPVEDDEEEEVPAALSRRRRYA